MIQRYRARRSRNIHATSGKTSGEMSRAKSAQLPGNGKRNADESLRGNLQDNSQRVAQRTMRPWASAHSQVPRKFSVTIGPGKPELGLQTHCGRARQCGTPGQPRNGGQHLEAARDGASTRTRQENALERFHPITSGSVGRSRFLHGRSVGGWGFNHLLRFGFYAHRPKADLARPQAGPA